MRSLCKRCSPSSHKRPDLGSSPPGHVGLGGHRVMPEADGAPLCLGGSDSEPRHPCCQPRAPLLTLVASVGSFSLPLVPAGDASGSCCLAASVSPVSCPGCHRAHP